MNALTFTPDGCNMLVDDLISETTLEHQAEAAGIALVLEQKSRPRNTMGTIIALGDDPYMTEEILFKGRKRPRWLPGDVVSFKWTAGTQQTIEGHDFRLLPWQDVLGTFRQELPDFQAQELLSAGVTQGVQSEQCLGSEPAANQCGTSYPGSSPAEQARTVHQEPEQPRGPNQ